MCFFGAINGEISWQETTQAVMSALAQVIRTEGLPMALYADRAG